MEDNKTNNTTQNQSIKPKVAKVAGTTSFVNHNASTLNTSDNKEDNLFASIYNSEKNNLSQTERITVSQKVEITKTENKKNGDNKKSKTVFIVLIALTAIIFISSCAYLIYGLFREDKTSTTDADTSVTLQTKIPSPFKYEHVYSDTYPEGIQEKYKMLYDQNKTIAGWIRVPNTSIDMPVYKWDNNSYYIRTDNYNVYSRYGVPFLDMYCGIKTLTKNTVLHGHNFNDGLIFNELHNYTDIEFLKENPVIEYNTIYQDYKWKVIAVFYTNGDSTGDNNYLFYYIAASMGNNSFMDFYDELQQRSLIHTGVDVLPTDKTLTLSTCTRLFDINGKREEGRLAVVARLIREGESEEIDTSLVKENANVRYPQLYYNKFGGQNPYVNASKWVPSND